MPTTSDRPADPGEVALDTALAVCAPAAHRGLLRITGARLRQIELAAGDLALAGLTTAAESLSAVSAWVAVELWLVATAERR